MGTNLSQSSLFYKLNLKLGSAKLVLFILLHLLLFTFLSGKTFAVTYYTGANGAANTLTSWWTGTGGTGTNPGNFTTAGDIFIIQSPHVMTTSGNWTCTGNTIVINSGGTLTTSTTRTITAATITIDGTYNAGSTGIITGNMTVGATTGVLALTTITSILTGNFTNNNSVTGTSGQLRVSGSITNTGTIVLTNAGRIRQTGSSDFMNSGSIIISGTGRIYFSGNFTNTGTLSLGASDVRLDGTGAGSYTINGFTTTGAVDLSTNTGTYTFTGNVSCTDILLSGSGSTLNLGASLTHTATGLVDIGAGEILNGGSSILNISAGGAAFINSGPGTFIAGTGTINYNCAGTQTVLAETYYNLTLSGTSAKTTTGVIVNNTLSMEGTATVTALPTYGGTATLQYNKPAAFTSGLEWKTPFTATGGVIIANTGVITLSASKTFTLCPLTVKAGATLNLLTRNLGSPSSVILECGAITGSTITGTTGILTLGGNIPVIDVTTGTSGATISALLALGATRTFMVEDDGTTAMDLTISNIISGATFGIIKDSLGTMVLSGVNTYTGPTTVSAGTLKLGASSSVLGTIAGITSVTSGAVLDLNGFVLSTAEPLTLNGTGLAALPAGALTNTGGNASYSGAITLGSASTITATSSGTLTASGTVGTGAFDLTLDGAAGTGTMSGIISTPTSVIKNGAGTWILSGGNTFTGVTTVSAGTLKLGSTTALGTSSATTVATGAVLDLNGFTLTTARPLTLNGTGLTALPAGALTNTGGNASYSGAITLGSASTITSTVSGTLTAIGTVGVGAFDLTLAGAGTGTMSGIISTPTSIIKEGASTWNLSGVNTYTGATTVNGGTLKAGVVTQAFGLTSAVTLANTAGAILDITGFANTIGSLTGGGATGGNVTLGASTLTIGSDNTSPAAYAGIISGTGAIIKSGTGTLILSGSNTYSGLTTIDVGILKLGATGGVTNTPLGTTGAGTIISTTGAALDLAGFTLANTTTFEALTLNGTGIALGGALMNSGAAATYSGLITLGSLSSIVGGTGTIAISHVGTITGSGFGLTLGGAQGGAVMSIIATVAGAVIKEDAGTWTLSGANTYSGGTSLNAGQLNINHLTAIGSGALTISGSTIIDNTSGGAIGPLTNNNAQTWNGNFTFTGTNDLNMGTGTITMGADVMITSSTIAKTFTVGGVNNNGTRSLTKAGAGNLTFGSNAITLTNITISAGTLTSTSGTMSIAGNFSNSATFTHNSGMITFNGSSAQTITGVSTFFNLTVNNAAGVVATTDQTVNSILNLLSTNASATIGCLEMGANTLTMGVNATTTGTGDVTGIVKRNSFATDTPYSFGNQFTTMTIAVGGTLPTDISFKIVIGAAPSWKTSAVMRTYDIIRTGGSGTTVTLSLHFLPGEIQSNTEGNLIFWDYEPAIPKMEEHGKASQNTTDHWLAISNRNITYFATSFNSKFWFLSNKESADFIWLGAASTDWNDINNWTGGVVPVVTSDVVIPDAATTVYDPVLPTSPAAIAKTITIQISGIIDGGTATTLTIAGAGGAWLNEGGTLNPATSTVTFTNANATIAGTTNFYNVTVDPGASLKPQTGSIMGIAGAITNNGTFDADDLVNTVDFNGGNQTVLNPNGPSPGYYHLIFSGSGTKTLPGAEMKIKGDFTNNVTFAHNSGTVTFKGALAQSINSGGSSFNNFTITNTGGTCTASNGITVAATFTTDASTTLDMGTNALIVNAVGHSGTLKTQNTSATPISITKTWGGTVQYNSTAAQTIVDGSYNNLNGTGGDRTLSSTDTIFIAGTFTVGVGTYTVTSSTVDFNGTAAQSIPAFNFNNLTISGNKGAGAITLVNGGTIGVAAVFSVTATNTSYIVTGNSFDYNGNGAQTIISPFNYNNLMISNAGVKTILTATTVNCQTITLNGAATLDILGTGLFNILG